MPTAHIWSKNVPSLLVGADPFEISALWDKLYEDTVYPGRRGLGIHALSAVDIALHDLAAKQIGKPVYGLSLENLFNRADMASRRRISAACYGETKQ